MLPQLGVWSLKLVFSQLGPKGLPSRKSRTQLSILTSKTSFYPESKGKCTELIKYSNESLPSSVGPKN